ncbi:MAG: hypothetical protein CMM41_01770 [Rhodospirillaceae bacterium]|nr:hypothetical protein [Rhodospirillaceae bacterium]
MFRNSKGPSFEFFKIAYKIHFRRVFQHSFTIRKKKLKYNKVSWYFGEICANRFFLPWFSVGSRHRH